MALNDTVRTAANQLANKEEPFTRIDVVNEAARGKGWSTALYKQAREVSHRLLQDAYNRGSIHRFGPVNVPNTNGVQDYLRAATEIVYGGPKAKAAIETPNGKFGPLDVKKDQIRQGPGRRPGAVRDDFKPWAEQDLKTKGRTEPAAKPPKEPKAKETAPPKGPPVDTRPLEARIQKLEQDVLKEQRLRAKAEQDLADFKKAAKAPAVPAAESIDIPIAISSKEFTKLLQGLGLVTEAQYNALRDEVIELKKAAQAPGAPTEAVDEVKLKELIKETLAEALIA
jgi:hypothetical protein